MLLATLVDLTNVSRLVVVSSFEAFHLIWSFQDYQDLVFLMALVLLSVLLSPHPLPKVLNHQSPFKSQTITSVHS